MYINLDRACACARGHSTNFSYSTATTTARLRPTWCAAALQRPAGIDVGDDDEWVPALTPGATHARAKKTLDGRQKNNNTARRRRRRWVVPTHAPNTSSERVRKTAAIVIIYFYYICIGVICGGGDKRGNCPSRYFIEGGNGNVLPTFKTYN